MRKSNSKKATYAHDPKTGEIIARYGSIREAARRAGVEKGRIMRALDKDVTVNGRMYTTTGARKDGTREHFTPSAQWLTEAKERLMRAAEKEQSKPDKRQRPVTITDGDTGETLARYDSVKEAAKALGTTPDHLNKLMREKKTYQGVTVAHPDE